MKKFLLLSVLAVIIAGGVFAVDFGSINSTLGPDSFSVDLYGGLIFNNAGVNVEWGIGSLPITVGLGISPFLIGEYATRIGYHPDLGIRGLDVYVNLTVGIWDAFFIPLLFVPQVGAHVGVRYFFGSVFGVFAEGGWSLNANYVKTGIVFKNGR
jgi:hypothetical protein